MLRQSLLCTCAVLLLGLLPACSSSDKQDSETAADVPAAAAAGQAQPTVLDDQLKALDKAKSVEATLEQSKAATDKAIDDASGG